MKQKRKNKTYKNNHLRFLVIGILIALIGICFYTISHYQKDILVSVAGDEARGSLQLETFKITSPPTNTPRPTKPETTRAPIPTSTPAAPPDYGTCVVNQPINNCTCGSSRVRWLYCPPNAPPANYDCLEGDPRCDGIIHDNPSCIWYCMDKPIIYLYPEGPTLVHVAVETPGEIIKSDPLYPEGGWKNVLAHPDGSLVYQGKNYRELFYETSVVDIKKPESGIILETKSLQKELNIFVSQLGLNEFEKNEFLEYWLPELQKLHTPYIFVSILDRDEKERIDHIEVQPAPETRIEFLAYFKGILTKNSDLKPFVFPSVPERKGFTMVEWGGTIDRKSENF